MPEAHKYNCFTDCMAIVSYCHIFKSERYDMAVNGTQKAVNPLFVATAVCALLSSASLCQKHTVRVVTQRNNTNIAFLVKKAAHISRQTQ